MNYSRFINWLSGNPVLEEDPKSLLWIFLVSVCAREIIEWIRHLAYAYYIINDRRAHQRSMILENPGLLHT